MSRKPAPPPRPGRPVSSDPLDEPPGFFRTRLCRGGPFVPCRLWREEERDEAGDLLCDVRYYAEVDGKPVDAASPPSWPWEPITRQTWAHMTALAAWARLYAPDEPCANPRRAMRLSEPRMY